jgi:hypothetical protein
MELRLFISKELFLLIAFLAENWILVQKVLSLSFVKWAGLF